MFLDRLALGVYKITTQSDFRLRITSRPFIRRDVLCLKIFANTLLEPRKVCYLPQNVQKGINTYPTH